MKNNVRGFRADKCLSVKPCMSFYIHDFTDRHLSALKPRTLFFIQTLPRIVCRSYKPCEFPGFVWTDYWGNKSYYVITSPANNMTNGFKGKKKKLASVANYAQTRYHFVQEEILKLQLLQKEGFKVKFL